MCAYWGEFEPITQEEVDKVLGTADLPPIYMSALADEGCPEVHVWLGPCHIICLRNGWSHLL